MVLHDALRDLDVLLLFDFAKLMPDVHEQSATLQEVVKKQRHGQCKRAVQAGGARSAQRLLASESARKTRRGQCPWRAHAARPRKRRSNPP
eukprot:1162420-Alexandrium_andersonii.AAC.1